MHPHRRCFERILSWSVVMLNSAVTGRIWEGKTVPSPTNVRDAFLLLSSAFGLCLAFLVPVVSAVAVVSCLCVRPLFASDVRSHFLYTTTIAIQTVRFCSLCLAAS